MGTVTRLRLPEPGALTIDDLAARWQCHPDTVRAFVEEGRLTADERGRITWAEKTRFESAECSAAPERAGPWTMERNTLLKIQALLIGMWTGKSRKKRSDIAKAIQTAGEMTDLTISENTLLKYIGEAYDLYGDSIDDLTSV